MFNLIEMKKKSGLNDRELERLERETRAEFPRDEMLFELHMVRALDALQNGWISKQELLAEPQNVQKASIGESN